MPYHPWEDEYIDPSFYDEEPPWMTAGLHRAPPDFSYEDEVRARQQVPGFEQSLYEEGPQAWGGEPYFPHEMAANEYTRGVLGGPGAAANIPTQSQIDDAGWRGPEMDPRTSQAISIDPRTRAVSPPARSRARSITPEMDPRIAEISPPARSLARTIEPSYARTADTYGIAQPPDYLRRHEEGLLGNILNRVDSSGIPLGSRGGASSMRGEGISEAPIPRWSDRQSFGGGFFPPVGEYVSGLVPSGTPPRSPLPTMAEAQERAKRTRLPQESAIVKALEQGFEFTGKLKAGRPLYRSLYKERGKGISAGLQSEHPLLRHQKNWEFSGELDADGNPLYFSRFKERATTAERRARKGRASVEAKLSVARKKQKKKYMSATAAKKERRDRLRKESQRRANYLRRSRDPSMYDPTRGYGG